MDGAGGWETRATCRRPAYESNRVRKARRTIDLLGHCLAQLNREQGVGSFSHTLQELLTGLRQRGLHPPTSSRATIAQWVAAELVVARRTLRDALQLMRSERQARWKDLVPRLWQDRPSVLSRWLEGNSPAWGSVPSLTATGTQCTTVQKVDEAVKGYWVDRVWRMHADRTILG